MAFDILLRVLYVFFQQYHASAGWQLLFGIKQLCYSRIATLFVESQGEPPPEAAPTNTVGEPRSANF